MTAKLLDSQIVRMPAIEKKYGIDNLKIYAYINGKNLNIIGEIFAKELKNSFELKCTVYDQDGDIVESFDNESYGSGLVTSHIKPVCFFNGYPFRMSKYLGEGINISKIRVVPK